MGRQLVDDSNHWELLQAPNEFVGFDYFSLDRSRMFTWLIRVHRQDIENVEQGHSSSPTSYLRRYCVWGATYAARIGKLINCAERCYCSKPTPNIWEKAII